MAMDFEWGKDTTAQYKKLVLQNGGEVLGETYFPLGSKDLSPYFGKILKAKPDILFCTAAGNDAIQLVNQLAEFGLKDRMQVAGAGSLVSGDVLKAMGKNANGILTADRYHVDIDSPENKRFVDKFSKNYKELPNKFSASTYEGAYVIAKAIEKAGSTDSEKIIKVLEGLQFMGPQGEKTIRAEDHQAILDMYILKCLDGKQIILGSKKGSEVIGPVTCPGF
jgi:branched-chain amino acid transport system substrate-binding protein